jgi:hypothetical protein
VGEPERVHILGCLMAKVLESNVEEKRARTCVILPATERRSHPAHVGAPAQLPPTVWVLSPRFHKNI